MHPKPQSFPYLASKTELPYCPAAARFASVQRQVCSPRKYRNKTLAAPVESPLFLERGERAQTIQPYFAVVLFKTVNLPKLRGIHINIGSGDSVPSARKTLL